MFGTPPTATSAWEPSIDGVSSAPSPERCTRTPVSVRSTDSARERETTLRPLPSKTFSSSSAASASSPGSTRSREETRVTLAPRRL